MTSDARREPGRDDAGEIPGAHGGGADGRLDRPRVVGLGLRRKGEEEDATGDREEKQHHDPGAHERENGLRCAERRAIAATHRRRHPRAQRVTRRGVQDRVVCRSAAAAVRGVTSGRLRGCRAMANRDSVKVMVAP